VYAVIKQVNSDGQDHVTNHNSARDVTSCSWHWLGPPWHLIRELQSLQCRKTMHGPSHIKHAIVVSYTLLPILLWHSAIKILSLSEWSSFYCHAAQYTALAFVLPSDGFIQVAQTERKKNLPNLTVSNGNTLNIRFLSCRHLDSSVVW